MSTWNLGIDDISEETQAFKDKLASKGKLGCSLNSEGVCCGLQCLSSVRSGKVGISFQLRHYGGSAELVYMGLCNIIC